MATGWIVVVASFALHGCLGTVYAWSYFQQPIMTQHGWSNAQVAWTLSIAIACLGVAAAVGGRLLPRLGARRLAIMGSCLYALAHGLAGQALASGSLPLLWLGFGGIGGVGLGLAYVVPVATVVRWFPARKGVVSGLVVMGFGLGALLMTKLLAPFMLAGCDGDLAATFTRMGLVLLAVMLPLALLIREPPRDGDSIPEPSGIALRAALLSRDFIALWVAFACAIAAGIMLIGFQSPLLQDLLRQRDPGRSIPDLAAAGANLIAVAALANGAGRLVWGAISDRIGRAKALRAILLLQTLAYTAMGTVSDPHVFGLLACLVLLGYGGAFATVPAFVAQRFGASAMAAVYGVALTAWSVGGLIGPQIAALIRDLSTSSPAGASVWIAVCGAGLAAIGLISACRLRDRPC